MKSIILLVAIFGIGCSVLMAQDQESKKERKKRERQETYQALKEIADSRSFIIKTTAAYPQKGGRVDLTARDNFLIMEDQEVKADLPYFGRAYSAPGYGESGGVQFDGNHSDYKVETNDKKRSVIITFTAKSSSESFTCTLTLTSLTNVSIFIQSNRRQGMRYQGSLGQD